MCATWRQKNPDVVRKIRAKNQYGIEPEQLDALYAKQGHKCGICGKPELEEKLCIDHDHKTKEVRGLLCKACNTGIALLGEDLRILRKAITYLESLQASKL